MNTTRPIPARAPSPATAPLPLLGFVLAIGLVLVMGGCSGALAPQFEAVGVREVQRTGDRTVLEFRVLASNPNREPIPLRSVSYRVELDGELVFEGVRSPETTLHTFSTHEFVLPAVVSSDLLRGSIPYALRGAVRYIPPGRLSEVLFDAELIVPEAPFDLSGNIETGG